MFTCFDLSLTEEEIDNNVLDGHYVLQAYATTHWLDHVEEGIQRDVASIDFTFLCKKIWRFLSIRSNQNFDRKSARDVDVLELKHFEKYEKELYRKLCHIHSSGASEISESTNPPIKYSESLSLKVVHMIQELFCLDSHDCGSILGCLLLAQLVPSYSCCLTYKILQYLIL